MPINESNGPIVHPYTHQVIQPGEYYEGNTHQGSEKLHDKKSIAAMNKAVKAAAAATADKELTTEEILQKEIEEAEAVRRKYLVKGGESDASKPDGLPAGDQGANP